MRNSNRIKAFLEARLTEEETREFELELAAGGELATEFGLFLLEQDLTDLLIETKIREKARQWRQEPSVEEDSPARKALTEYFEAIHHKDWIKLDACLDPGFTYFTDQAVSRTRREFMDLLQNEDWQGHSYEINIHREVRARNNDFALLTYLIRFAGETDGELIRFQALETTTLIRSEKHWCILHTHCSNKLDD